MFFTRKSLAFSSEISHYPLCRGYRVGPPRRRERPLPLIRPRLRTKVIVMDKKKIFLVSLGHLSCDINGGAVERGEISCGNDILCDLDTLLMRVRARYPQLVAAAMGFAGSMMDGSVTVAFEGRKPEETSF